MINIEPSFQVIVQRERVRWVDFFLKSEFCYESGVVVPTGGSQLEGRLALKLQQSN